MAFYVRQTTHIGLLTTYYFEYFKNYDFRIILHLHTRHCQITINCFLLLAPNGVNTGTIITTPTFITVFLEPIPGVTAHEVRVANVENLSDVRTVDPSDLSLSHVAMYVVV